jgi:hypothetical protein
MRKFVLIPLLALALAASASAAVRESPYQAWPTRHCLISHGAHHLRSPHTVPHSYFGFGEYYDAFRWNAGSGALDPITRVPRDWIGIEFTPNPARGRASERRVRHILRADYGFDAAWVRQHLLRQANVVILAFSTNRPLTAKQRSLIVGCLRR